jgi:hypothetical protein
MLEDWTKLSDLIYKAVFWDTLTFWVEVASVLAMGLVYPNEKGAVNPTHFRNTGWLSLIVNIVDTLSMPLMANVAKPLLRSYVKLRTVVGFQPERVAIAVASLVFNSVSKVNIL